MSWVKYRVTVTRLIEEECHVYVTCKDEAQAQEQALDVAAETPEVIWVRTNNEPHTYSVDKIENAANPKEFGS